MSYITFEEAKEILKKSIDETTNINEALEKAVEFIYLRGYEDGQNFMPFARPESSTDIDNALALLDGIHSAGRMEFINSALTETLCKGCGEELSPYSYEND